MVFFTACHQQVEPPKQSVCLEITPSAVKLPSASLKIGSQTGYPEEVTRSINVEAFDIDATEVTNAQFREFISATGYVTTAELPQPGSDTAGGAVFKSPTASHPSWWHFIEGANWQHPEGPESSIVGRDNDPVVQVSLVDARAYAKWAGRAVPTEGQWEYAASAGRQSKYVWGDERAPNGEEQANTWQGTFPVQNTLADGFALRAPIGCYAPNNFGLYDMIGNVWEWTKTPYEQIRIPNSYTIKGGSYLCAENFCARYRAPARQSQEIDFSTNHIGFRTVSKPVES